MMHAHSYFFLIPRLNVNAKVIIAAAVGVGGTCFLLVTVVAVCCLVRHRRKHGMVKNHQDVHTEEETTEITENVVYNNVFPDDHRPGMLSYLAKTNDVETFTRDGILNCKSSAEANQNIKLDNFDGVNTTAEVDRMVELQTNDIKEINIAADHTDKKQDHSKSIDTSTDQDAIVYADGNESTQGCAARDVGAQRHFYAHETGDMYTFVDKAIKK